MRMTMKDTNSGYEPTALADLKAGKPLRLS